MIKNRGLLYFWYFSLLVFLSGCAQHYTYDTFPEPYGFLSGILHGVIFPIALFAVFISWLASLLDIHILNGIYLIGQPNTGLFFYYIGFIIGLSMWGANK